MRKIKLLIAILLILFLSNTCSVIDPDVVEFTDFDSEISKEMSSYQIPSISACVIKNDEMVWIKYYGNSTVNNSLPDSETIYPVASVSKTIIVTAVMQLFEQELIDLDADINNYLPISIRNPNYPDNKISARMLLTHTSGLAWPVDDYEVPGFYNYYPLDSAPPLSEWIPQYVLPGGSHYVNAVWKNTVPGERELYSNIGTAVLGYLVEVISGMDFNTYCTQNIFTPLEMNSTSYAYSDLNMNNVVNIYWDNYQQIEHYRQLHFPAQSLKTTIEDYSHLLIMCMNGGDYNGTRILQEGTTEQILQLHNPASGRCLIWKMTVGGWYEHQGGEPGVAAQVEFHPEKKVGLIIFSNKRTGQVYAGNKIHAMIRRIANGYF
ncbi:MAG: beta-lactamase family protein [Ignavibacteriaceae bacterium]|nr:beta-lactamase family protein [Ignavibacteriaceae bacterium]